MNCLNCNKEAPGKQVFCDDCLAAMENFPVQKGTPVIIPEQPTMVQSKKQPTHWHASAEEELTATKKANRQLAFLTIVLALLLASATLALMFIFSSDSIPSLF